MKEIIATSWSPSEAASQPAPMVHDAKTIVLMSGLFDERFYRNDYGDVGGDALAHFMETGWRAGFKPNHYFETSWYLRCVPAVAAAGINPLVHYILGGEAAGYAPSEYFDPLWYRAHHQVEPGDTLLRHFLSRRLREPVSPLPEFDARYYRDTYQDIAETADCDPFWHYLKWGWEEGRNPSAAFDTKFYVQHYFDGKCDTNPLMFHRKVRALAPFRAVPSAADGAMYGDVTRFSAAGPAFERRARLPRAAPRRAKLLAYYLPQFHHIPENDAWWGEGFTEWTALARGQPRFAGHYQPRAPRDLGHYTLDDPETIRRQIALARDAGLFGFIFYFYWFSGRRLLEKPLELFLADQTLDFPFCLMWANENWTRAWDGSDDEILIEQQCRPEDDAALVDCFARHFRDARYIRIDGRPLLLIYRPHRIPNTRATVARWRGLFADRHGEHPILVMAQSFRELDPRPFGLDGAVEFPPHKLTANMKTINATLTPFDPRATANVHAYDDVAKASLAEAAPPYPLIKTIVPSWDNDARRQGKGLVVHGSTPALYQSWLEALIDRTEEQRFFGERIVCVNAWNEWAEGAYLEPDVHFGAAYLNATGRAVTRLPPTESLGRLLLIGHDAFPAGAQFLLLNLGRALRRDCGAQVEFLLLGDGALRAEYEAVAPTFVAAEASRVAALLKDAFGRGITAAIINTAAAAWAVELATRAGLRATLLIHELPQLLQERDLVAGATAGADAAARIVFPATCVVEKFRDLIPIPPERTQILPQGCYRPVRRDPRAAAAVRARLGIRPQTRLVLGIGTGDMRKGFDIFLQTWRATRRRARSGIVFCWLGRIDPALQAWLGGEIAEAEATGTFHVPGFQKDLDGWFTAAAVLALTSREDPFPTVVLEALSAGLPVAAFADSGGAPDLITALDAGVVVPMADAESLAEALDGICARDWSGEADRLSRAIRDGFDFTRYAKKLFHAAQPLLPAISVAVPSCDYARYLPERLGAIFAQTVPVGEILFLDDASRDQSIAAAEAAARDWQRTMTVVARDTRTGSAFGQWHDAVERAAGDWLWIAEADDAAEPGFLSRMVAAIIATPDLVLAACDSRAIDADGKAIWPSYQAYYADSGAAALARDFVMPAREFARRFLAERNLLLNASAVVWRRSDLRAALARCGASLPDWRAAGDWRVYLELLADSDGQVAWIAEPLNVHRRHGQSVTGSMSPRAQTREIARMHRLARERLDLDDAALARQASYRARLARQFRAAERS